MNTFVKFQHEGEVLSGQKGCNYFVIAMWKNFLDNPHDYSCPHLVMWCLEGKENSSKSLDKVVWIGDMEGNEIVRVPCFVEDVREVVLCRQLEGFSSIDFQIIFSYLFTD